jgi:hypothetical protein
MISFFRSKGLKNGFKGPERNDLLHAVQKIFSGLAKITIFLPAGFSGFWSEQNLVK